MLLKKNKIAYLGILLALNQIFIILASIIETNTIILYAGAALFIGIVIVEFNLKSGVMFYVTSCILGLILSFNKVKLISYILFFGIYSIIKYLIEKKMLEKGNKIYFELLIKFFCFNILLIISYFIIKSFISIKLLWWMVVFDQFLFLIYDYAFGLFINYYINKIRPKLNR